MSKKPRWIVIGAGSAGCVLANRLSADGSIDVLLLDDGPPLLAGTVPAAIDGPSFLDAVAEPGRIHEDLIARRTPESEPKLYMRGRGFGGSSAVNAMVALHGDDALYRSWGWHDCADAWERVAIPSEPVETDAVGPVSRALCLADTQTESAVLTRRQQRRVTAAEAYLWPALDRENLTARSDAGVESITFDARRATGVVLTDGTTLDADRVIVSAGAIHSPAILLRSGVDTPGVGTGLQDHPSAVLALLLHDGLHDPGTIAVGSHLHFRVHDHLIQVLPMNHLGREPETQGLGALLIALMTPQGADGSVTIDANGEPVVDFAMLQSAGDIDALVAGVRHGLRLLEHDAFAEIVAGVFIDELGTPSSALDSDGAIVAWLRRECADYVHASSTCAMGRVVDDDGAVIGYGDLFVCDASVFPHVPDANTHLPTTMLAERLSPRIQQR